MPPRSPLPIHGLPPPFLLPSLQLPHTWTRTLRSLNKKFKPNRFNIGPHLPVLTSTKTAALARKEYTTPFRTGALAVKKGMTAVFDPATAKRTPCTVLQLDRVQVISHKTRKLNGYWAVQVGCGSKEMRNVTRPERGHFAINSVPLKRELVEFKVKNADGLLKVGTQINADWFQEGQFVDARANCRGMGFAGGMKRHGWSGQPASHGTSLTHRAMGSAGASQGSGSRVHPGKKMAGRMGGQQVTVQSLKVLKVDAQNGLVVVNGGFFSSRFFFGEFAGKTLISSIAGCVPGPKNCTVKLQDAIKKPWPEVSVAPPMADAAAEPLRTAAQAAA